MKKYKYTRNNLQEILSEVEEGLGWSEEINIQMILKNIIQKSLDKEFLDTRQSDWYERLEDKNYTSNGNYPIYLKTNYGDIQILKPRFRGAEFNSKIIENYKQNYKSINFAIVESYLMGQSLRNTSISTELFTGIAISRQTISNLLKKLDTEIFKFHYRKITKNYKYIYLDGKYFKVKERGKIRRYVVLIVLGVTEDNKKELIDFNIAKSEKEQNWTRLLNHLTQRGLDFDQVKLIVSDKAGGILASLINYYPMTPHQLCMFHKIANINKYLNKRANRKKILNDASNCYKEANSKAEFRDKLIKFKLKWQADEPRAVKCFSKDYDKTLIYFDFPKIDWHLISTNNLLERTIECISPKIRAVRYFQNLKSAERIIGLSLLRKEGFLNLDMFPV